MYRITLVSNRTVNGKLVQRVSTTMWASRVAARMYLDNQVRLLTLSGASHVRGYTESV